MQNSASRKSFF